MKTKNVGDKCLERDNCWDGGKKCWTNVGDKCWEGDKNVGLRQNVRMRQKILDKCWNETKKRWRQKCWDETKILGETKCLG